jgi:hypothetical protein
MFCERTRNAVSKDIPRDQGCRFKNVEERG